ncbi:hypothetical protein T12_5925 [Trichinella patagoniensis]|uniref:Uncharacterized protein n=1 Tax=Trichinella patagoniensis TaxID=990121 RepID=A0A0V1A5X4_9BILA|nr:hypothetical protein T12_5925 [Trichinella patagoniensis]
MERRKISSSTILTLIAKSPIRKLQSKRPIREKQMLSVPVRGVAKTQVNQTASRDISLRPSVDGRPAF